MVDKLLTNWRDYENRYKMRRVGYCPVDLLCRDERRPALVCWVPHRLRWVKIVTVPSVVSKAGRFSSVTRIQWREVW